LPASKEDLMKIRIANGRVIDPANKTDCVQDVFIADG
jgi:formylmethanofuran dehydrogenase subunit A